MQIAQAQTVNIFQDRTIQCVIVEIVRPLIVLLFAIALLYFLWGVTRYIWSLSKGGKDGIDNGRKHMIWGIIGLGIMLSVFGIINVIFNTFTLGGNQGLSGETTRPSILRGLPDGTCK
jgi:hypothetical protein